MENKKIQSPVLQYLKSLKTNTTEKHEEFNTSSLKLNVVFYTTTLKSLKEESETYSVGLMCEDISEKILYSNRLYKKFDDKNEAERYYNFIKNKIITLNEYKLFKAIKEDNPSLL